MKAISISTEIRRVLPKNEIWLRPDSNWYFALLIAVTMVSEFPKRIKIVMMFTHQYLRVKVTVDTRMEISRNNPRYSTNWFILKWLWSTLQRLTKIWTVRTSLDSAFYSTPTISNVVRNNHLPLRSLLINWRIFLANWFNLRRESFICNWDIHKVW